MRHPFGAGAAVVVLTAVLAACGSSASSSPGGAPEAGGTGTVRSPLASRQAGPAAPAPGAQAPLGASAQPKVPVEQLTPATGSFTVKQKKYLTGRVPRGMDPAAVLQTGQETCDRLRYLVKADRDVAVGAIVTGEIPDAKPAIEHLCTQRRDLLREAARGYADGTYRGARLRPGRYRVVSPTARCSWQITGADGTSLAGGNGGGNGKRTVITVGPQARVLTSAGCYAWLPEGGIG
ncbi:hypothetical protein ACFVWY_05455 [Streptomyces sp. NPDC058195]|uniref:hypothetical protein n=1 Tax=Streptomyces sp. NPDC058195 TaxID=3346375 RepID=UPI0036EDCA96